MSYFSEHHLFNVALFVSSLIAVVFINKPLQAHTRDVVNEIQELIAPRPLAVADRATTGSRRFYSGYEGTSFANGPKMVTVSASAPLDALSKRPSLMVNYHACFDFLSS
jgi:hypothetical protein